MVPRENSDEASSEATAKTARPKLLNNFKQTTTVAGDGANEASGDGDQGPFDDKPVEANDSENDGDHNSLLDESMLANLESKRLEEESAMAKSDVPTEFHDLPMDASETDEGPEFESRDAEHFSDGEMEQPMDTSVANEHTTGLPEELDEMGKADADQQMQSFQYQPGAGDLANADAAAFQNTFEDEYHGQGPSDPRVATGAGAATNSLNSVSDTGSVQPIGESQRGGEKLTGPSGQRDPVEHTSSQSTSRRHGPRPTSDGRSQDVNSIGSAVRGEVLESVDSKEELVDHDEEFDSSTCGLYQHLPPDKSDAADDSSLVHVVDSATEAQRNQQVSVPPEDHPADVMVLENDHEDLTAATDAVPTEIVKNPPSLSTCRKTSKSVDQTASHNEHDLMTTDPDVELVPTLGAQRPPESLICTQREHSSYFDPLAIPASLEPLPVDYAGIHLLSDDFTKATIEWSACVHRSANLAHQLCESLRLVLEPTKAARMRGDYRTGKRINMRKIIPYLASHFRKDKIWLRRSQPSQREYRILIAVDDSSSMSDNLCRQMTFDALATVTTAFALLEVGRIGVCSFGESVRVLHDLKDAWTGETGPSVVSRFTFQQSRTSLVQLIHSALTMMQECQFHKSTGGTPSQLLLILSDGVFSEDPQDPNVQAAIRLARDSNLFPVCLILDDVRKKVSPWVIVLPTDTLYGLLKPLGGQSIAVPSGCMHQVGFGCLIAFEIDHIIE
ncbi:unnamed protein product [Dicrocoelium dendriticum]|nr:unnamed protein product [Dicrocoelium dendriticum]